jgi:hypothetical protein
MTCWRMRTLSVSPRFCWLGPIRVPILYPGDSTDGFGIGNFDLREQATERSTVLPPTDMSSETFLLYDCERSRGGHDRSSTLL